MSLPFAHVVHTSKANVATMSLTPLSARVNLGRMIRPTILSRCSVESLGNALIRVFKALSSTSLRSSSCRLMSANLAASLIAAEAIETTEAKAKALRPYAEKLITKAKKASAGSNSLHRHRQLVANLNGDLEMAQKLVDEIGPRYQSRPGGYTRILKLGPRQGDKAPMALIELV